MTATGPTETREVCAADGTVLFVDRPACHLVPGAEVHIDCSAGWGDIVGVVMTPEVDDAGNPAGHTVYVRTRPEQKGGE